MTARHHPSEKTLLSYAGGTLPKALHLVVSMHLEQCTVCQTEISFWEKIGGALLEDVPASEISPDILDKTLARLSEPSIKPKVRRTRKEYWLGPGIRYSPFFYDKTDGTRLYQLRIRPGTKLPAHGHDGLELSHVVASEIADGESSYSSGDFLEADYSQEHEPYISGEQECLCVIGSKGPPRVPGVIGLIMRAVI